MEPSACLAAHKEGKQACGEVLLLFRVGDFYELFHDDARVAAGVLSLTLVSLVSGEGESESEVLMARFPCHQLEAYLTKLIAAGHRAAVCEQVPSPSLQPARGRRSGNREATSRKPRQSE